LGLAGQAVVIVARRRVGGEGTASLGCASGGGEEDNRLGRAG